MKLAKTLYLYNQFLITSLKKKWIFFLMMLHDCKKDVEVDYISMYLLFLLLTKKI